MHVHVHGPFEMQEKQARRENGAEKSENMERNRAQRGWGMARGGTRTGFSTKRGPRGGGSKRTEISPDRAEIDQRKLGRELDRTSGEKQGWRGKRANFRSGTGRKEREVGNVAGGGSPAPVPHDEKVLEADPGAAVHLLQVVQHQDGRQIGLPVQPQHQLQQPLHPYQPLPAAPPPFSISALGAGI